MGTITSIPLMENICTEIKANMVVAPLSLFVSTYIFLYPTAFLLSYPFPLTRTYNEC
jgi:hypothetical protein